MEDIDPIIVDRTFVVMPTGIERWVGKKRASGKAEWAMYLDGKQIRVYGKVVGRNFVFESEFQKKQFMKRYRLQSITYADRSPEAIAERKRERTRVYMRKQRRSNRG